MTDDAPKRKRGKTSVEFYVAIIGAIATVLAAFTTALATVIVAVINLLGVLISKSPDTSNAIWLIPAVSILISIPISLLSGNSGCIQFINIGGSVICGNTNLNTPTIEPTSNPPSPTPSPNNETERNTVTPNPTPTPSRQPAASTSTPQLCGTGFDALICITPTPILVEN